MYGLLPAILEPHPNRKLDSRRAEALGQECQVDRVKLRAAAKMVVFANAV